MSLLCDILDPYSTFRQKNRLGKEEFSYLVAEEPRYSRFNTTAWLMTGTMTMMLTKRTIPMAGLVTPVYIMRTLSVSEARRFPIRKGPGDEPSGEKEAKIIIERHDLDIDVGDGSRWPFGAGMFEMEKVKVNKAMSESFCNDFVVNRVVVHLVWQ